MDVSLRDSFDVDGNITCDLTDYICHVNHMEETEKLLKDNKLVHNPFTAGK